jgi:hypothetical protein
MFIKEQMFKYVPIWSCQINYPEVKWSFQTDKFKHWLSIVSVSMDKVLVSVFLKGFLSTSAHVITSWTVMSHWPAWCDNCSLIGHPWVCLSCLDSCTRALWCVWKWRGWQISEKRCIKISMRVLVILKVWNLVQIHWYSSSDLAFVTDAKKYKLYMNSYVLAL